MSSKCNCEQYADIELSGSAVDDRIKASKKIRKGMNQLAESPETHTRLYKCDVCDQLWQESLAWGWERNQPTYLFKVPAISVPEWLQESYIQPHEFVVLNATIARVLKHVVEKDEPCGTSGCTGKAIAGSLSCLTHHIESLQRAGLLPKAPKGRWFGPYTQAPFSSNL